MGGWHPLTPSQLFFLWGRFTVRDVSCILCWRTRSKSSTLLPYRGWMYLHKVKVLTGWPCHSLWLRLFSNATWTNRTAYKDIGLLGRCVCNQGPRGRWCRLPNTVLFQVLPLHLTLPWLYLTWYLRRWSNNEPNLLLSFFPYDPVPQNVLATGCKIYFPWQTFSSSKT